MAWMTLSSIPFFDHGTHALLQLPTFIEVQFYRSKDAGEKKTQKISQNRNKDL